MVSLSTKFILFSHQKLVGHIDGTTLPSLPKITNDGKVSPNSAYATWIEEDQNILLLLQSSLTEEAVAEVIRVTTTRDLWTTLERAYSYHSIEHAQNLRGALRQLKKGNLFVSNYGKKFKSLCDQLAAIVELATESDKSHWFLCGLGPAFEGFSTAQRVVYPLPCLRDLLSRAESHELFLISYIVLLPLLLPLILNNIILATKVPSLEAEDEVVVLSQEAVAGAVLIFSFVEPRVTMPPSVHNYQLFNNMLLIIIMQTLHALLTVSFVELMVSIPLLVPQLTTFQQHATPYTNANLAQAFHLMRNVNEQSRDRCVDSGATAHMAPSTQHLDHVQPYAGQNKVAFGNVNTLSISHIGN
ncbi:uncharacterized protein LOC143602738 [Bidens hawaiensis]|uniref:uncharacterized protein LOC143602738 n=1 Tax=Bidens hawaiensis TaxID=980011 RepID=UPI004049AB7A